MGISYSAKKLPGKVYVGKYVVEKEFYFFMI